MPVGLLLAWLMAFVDHIQAAISPDEVVPIALGKVIFALKRVRQVSDVTIVHEKLSLTVLPDEYRGPGARNFATNQGTIWNCSNNAVRNGGLSCCDPFNELSEGSCCPGQLNVNLFVIGTAGVQVQSRPPSSSFATTPPSSSTSEINSSSRTSSTSVSNPDLVASSIAGARQMESAYGQTSLSSPTPSASSLDPRTKSVIGVGVSLGVTALIAVSVAAYLFKRSRRRQDPTTPTQDQECRAKEETMMGGFMRSELSVQTSHELPALTTLELPSAYGR
ncbi:MAG: hypothetical protein M1814_005495 [Vezdaea aestivalis]|nr:MAG: hypothetical protein M1814_005495 [Vezdaea aestivalis]